MARYLFIFGNLLFAQVTSTVCAIYIANLCQRFQLGRPKYIQALVGLLSFTLGIIIGGALAFGGIFFTAMLAREGGYGILTIYFWLMISCFLQVLINIFMVWWNIFFNKSISYTHWQIAFLILCGVPAYIIAINI